jgi:radical SAM protein (TIGR01212 family)
MEEQLRTGIARIRKRFHAKKFLAYFQAFTNTYAPEGMLRQLYDLALEAEDVVGLCIGTRPDCLPDNVLDLLAEYDVRTFLWLEVGLQSASDQTLELINRGHSAAEFFDAIKRVKMRGLKIATHLMFGLPGESEEMMLDSVKRTVEAGVDGIKIHQLCIYKGTAMERDYLNGQLPVLSEDTYVDLVVRALEILPPDMVVMRVVAEGSRDEIIAPEWCLTKIRVMEKIDQLLLERDTWQGKKFNASVLV